LTRRGESLQQRFGFHPLAIDDALHETHALKLHDWKGYLYIVLQDVNDEADRRQLRLPELDISWGDRCLVTCHKEPVTAVDR
jgi:magnesium transporter